jgi:hypothetical protein
MHLKDGDKVTSCEIAQEHLARAICNARQTNDLTLQNLDTNDSDFQVRLGWTHTEGKLT